MKKSNSMVVIGDCHACLKTLKALVKKLPKNVPICLVGDQIDRGPDSKKVIEYVRKKKYLTVLGNHEDMCMNDQGPPFDPYHSPWLYNGGLKAIQSYGKDVDPILAEHRKWMRTLPLYLEFKNIKNDKGQHLLVSHTSAADAFEYKAKTKKSIESKVMFAELILWERNLQPEPMKNIFNVFGHTPVTNPFITDHFAAIDTGCVFSNDASYGTLTAIQFPEMEIYQQENIDAR
jgi:serine/threonine protein phosphatase 1